MFRYSMTLRGGNPQALMLPTECLHHYHVDPHAQLDAQAPQGSRLRQWWRAVTRKVTPVR
ncbi:hypothetical protein [Pandoraea pneumonica]|nr:hypothetical protein [Pandoraea pneumonica]